MWRNLPGAAACLVLMSGCGAASSAAPDGALGPGGDARAAGGFVGNWLYAQGTTTRTCPGQAPSLASPEGGLSITTGGAGQLIVTEPGACAPPFQVVANVATIVSGQTCSGSDGAGGQVTFKMLTWKLTLSNDGQTLAEQLAADEILAPASGPTRTCRYTEDGVTLRRQ